MRLSLRVLVAAAAVAIPLSSATPASAYPCWQSHKILENSPVGNLYVPLPSDLNC